MACIYFVYSGNHIKIGTTGDVFYRSNHLAGSSPLPVSVLFVEPGGRAEERAYHARFSKSRSYGEWFRFDAELRIFVEANLDQRVGGRSILAVAEDRFREWLEEHSNSTQDKTAALGSPLVR